MRVEIRNRTGLTIVTSGSATARSVAIGATPVELDADAWAHTLECAPSLGRLVGLGEEKIEVRQVGASPSPGPDASPAPTLSNDDELRASDIASEVEKAIAASAPIAPPPTVTQPRQQGGGKRRR